MAWDYGRDPVCYTFLQQAYSSPVHGWEYAVSTHTLLFCMRHSLPEFDDESISLGCP